MSKLLKTLSVILLSAIISACNNAPLLPLDKGDEPTVRDISKMVERTLTQMTSAAIFQDTEHKASIYVSSVTSFTSIDTISTEAVTKQIKQRISLSPNFILADSRADKNLNYELAGEFYFITKGISASYDYRELVFKLKLYNLNNQKTTEWTEVLKLNRLEGAWE